MNCFFMKCEIIVVLRYWTHAVSNINWTDLIKQFELSCLQYLEMDVIHFSFNVYLVPLIQGSNLFIYFDLYRIYKQILRFQVSIFCHAYLVQVHVSRRCHIIIKWSNLFLICGSYIVRENEVWFISFKDSLIHDILIRCYWTSSVQLSIELTIGQWIL